MGPRVIRLRGAWSPLEFWQRQHGRLMAWQKGRMGSSLVLAERQHSVLYRPDRGTAWDPMQTW